MMRSLSLTYLFLGAFVALASPAAAETVMTAPLGPPPVDKVALPLTAVGRAILSDDGLAADYSWPLSGAEAWFDGNEVTIRVSDQPSRLSVRIDDREIADIGHPGDEDITIRDLPPAWLHPHHVEIIKYNESLTSTGHILGIYAARPGKASPHVFKGQMEVIGDSWTSGYGNVSGSRFCSPQELSDGTDARQTWGVMVARELDFDMHMAAYSGIGIVRNYDGVAPGHTMPAIYGDATFTDKRPFESANWQPSLIIISLGGNDFEVGLHDDEKWSSPEALHADFVDGYVAFVRDLRRRYPKAGILLKNYGEKDVVSGTTEIMNRLQAEGESHIATYSAMGPFEQTGCDWHLNTNDYKKIADGLVTFLRDHPALWQGN